MTILQQAYSKITSVGSATAMIAIKHGRQLRVSNLGDSGFILIRFSKEEEPQPYCVYRSKE